jgi:lipopolysaccharide export system protein LptA
MRVIFPCLIVLALISPELAAEEAFDVSADRLYGRRTAETEIVVLKDNVRIVHGSTVATADSGFYDKSAETLKLMGRARVMEGGVEVRGEECVYRRLDRKVTFPSGMQALDSLSMVVADSGSYDLDTEVLDVAGNVFYSEGARTIEADRAIYYRRSEQVEAMGDVVIVDADYGATLRAEYVTYDRPAGHGVAVGRPVLEVTGRGGERGAGGDSEGGGESGVESGGDDGERGPQRGGEGGSMRDGDGGGESGGGAAVDSTESGTPDTATEGAGSGTAGSEGIESGPGGPDQGDPQGPDRRARDSACGLHGGLRR